MQIGQRILIVKVCNFQVERVKAEGSLKKTASEYHGAFQISVFSLNT